VLGYPLIMGLFTDTALAEYAQRLVNLKGQEDVTFKKVLDNAFIRDLVTDLNSKIQLGEDHVTSLGEKLFNKITNSSTYAESDPLGRGGQPYEVFRTGEYWDSFKAVIGSGFITIDSNPAKDNNNLFDVYGPNLEGLTDKNLQILINASLEQYINWYKRNILPQ